MLNFELNRAEGILILEPIGPLESTDFEKLAREVILYHRKRNTEWLDDFYEIISWMDNFAAFLSHIKFVKNHHQKLKRLRL